MVRQQRDGLDRLGMGEQPRRPRPMAGPFRAGLRRQRRDVADRALGNVARDGRGAIEILLADAVGEEIDEAGDIRLRLLDQAR